MTPPLGRDATRQRLDRLFSQWDRDYDRLSPRERAYYERPGMCGEGPLTWVHHKLSERFGDAATAWWLYHELGLSYGEIARRLGGIRANAVRRRVERVEREILKTERVIEERERAG